MSIFFLIYDSSTGRLLKRRSMTYKNEERKQVLLTKTLESSDTVFGTQTAYYIVQDEDEWSISGSYIDTESNQLKSKTDLGASWNKTTILADGTDEAVLSNLPIPCQVYLDYIPYEITDGSFEFSTTDAGFYTVEIDHPAYFKQVWEIEAS